MEGTHREKGNSREDWGHREKKERVARGQEEAGVWRRRTRDWLWVQEAVQGGNKAGTRAGGSQRNKPQNMQKPFPLSRKMNNRFINKFYKAVQLFKAFW